MRLLLQFLLLVAATAGASACRKQEAPKSDTPAVGSQKPAASANAVIMTAEGVREAGVRTEPAQEQTLVVNDDIPGSIEAPSDALAVVNARAAAVVDALSVDVGDRVKAGQKLGMLRSIDLAEAQAAYERAAVASKYAATALERTETLKREGVLSQRRVDADRLELDQKKLEAKEASDRVRILGGAPGGGGGAIPVVSPIAGVVASRNANRGQAVEANGPLFTVVDISRVVVQLRAPAGTPVVPGTEVTFTVEALQNREFTARVKSASDLLDPETRRFLIRCSVDNKDGVLKPGMFLTARLPRESVKSVTVPERAIQNLPDGTAVFVATGPVHFEKRIVVVGARSEGRVAIQKGVTAGEPVVVDGAFWVKTQLQKSELEE